MREFSRREILVSAAALASAGTYGQLGRRSDERDGNGTRDEVNDADNGTGDGASQRERRDNRTSNRPSADSRDRTSGEPQERIEELQGYIQNMEKKKQSLQNEIGTGRSDEERLKTEVEKLDRRIEDIEDQIEELES